MNHGKSNKHLFCLLTIVCYVAIESFDTKTIIAADPSDASDQTIIAFGVCAHEDRPQPICNGVVAANPDLFIFAGDNIYADTRDMDVMRGKYSKLAAQPGYQKLLETCPILAVWDDHDFGVNDGGRTYPKRAESAKIFLDFFGVPQNDPRRDHEGIYASQIIGTKDHRAQIILLDTRYFRDDLDRYAEGEKKTGNIVAGTNPPRTTVVRS